MSEKNFSPDSLSAKEFETEQKFRTKERNKYRKIGEKLFGQNKTEFPDVAIEEALRMNDSIKKMLIDGQVATTDEAIEKVMLLPEFQLKSEDRIKKEEFARFISLQFAAALEEYDIEKGLSIIREGQKRGQYDEEIINIINDLAYPLASRKLEEMITRKDGRHFGKTLTIFTQMFDFNMSRLKINAESDAVQSAEFKEGLKSNIIETLEYSLIPPDYRCFRSLVETSINIKSFSRQEISGWPEIKNIIKEQLTERMQYSLISPDFREVIELKNFLVRGGLITKEEIEQWPETKIFLSNLERVKKNY